jgi:hypothetical protein
VSTYVILPSNLSNTLRAHGLVVSETLSKLVERLASSILVEEDVTLEPPWQRCLKLIASESTHGNGEDVVKLFQRALLGLGHPEEDHDESKHIHTTVTYHVSIELKLRGTKVVRTHKTRMLQRRRKRREGWGK